MELLGLSRAELSKYCQELGHSSFRGKQIAEWLYKKGVHDVSEMTNLPVSLREHLAANTTLTRSEIAQESKSKDGTTKYLLKLSDGETIESVLLPYADRTSVCVSTQVGCKAGCVFCATADCGFVRNLTTGEIVDQVLTLQEKGEQRVSHVVIMGMGEPLMNMRNVMNALDVLNDEVGISMRRITLSTVGITPAIRELGEKDRQFTLAISLHAPDNQLRQQLIPMSSRFPLGDLVQACREFANNTKRRITFEYLMLAGVNDSPQQAHQLASLLRGVMGHVNLIPYNEVADKQFHKSPKETIAAFRKVLELAGIEITQRFERGHDVSAACGQLRRRQVDQD